MVNQLYLLIAWCALTGEDPVSSMIAVERWNQDVALYAYGDDAILSGGRGTVDVYNGVTNTDFSCKIWDSSNGCFENGTN